ncbi:MAG TPA: metal ABC transporter permease [Acidimicrobiia bacterium]
MHALLEPWTHGFMQRSLIELVLVGALTGVLGCWIVFYELAYSAESLSHALFPGLVGAALLGLPLLLGAAVGLGAGALGIALAGAIRGVGRDTAVAIVVTTLFGLGVLLALTPASPPGIQQLLFGDPLAVVPSDLVVAGILCAAALVALAALHRPLLALAFDRSNARALRLRPLPIELSLVALIAVAILVAVQALGNLLVVAVLVAPAASARLLTRRFPAMMLVAVAIAIAASVCGLYLSYYAGVAAGASIAVMLVGAYALAHLVESARRLRQTRLRQLRST